MTMGFIHIFAYVQISPDNFKISNTKTLKLLTVAVIVVGCQKMHKKVYSLTEHKNKST